MMLTPVERVGGGVLNSHKALTRSAARAAVRPEVIQLKELSDRCIYSQPASTSSSVTLGRGRKRLCVPASQSAGLLMGGMLRSGTLTWRLPPRPWWMSAETAPQQASLWTEAQPNGELTPWISTSPHQSVGLSPDLYLMYITIFRM